VKRWIRSTNILIVNTEQSQTAMFGDETVSKARQETIPPSTLTVCVIHKPTDDIINNKHGREMHLYQRPHWTFFLFLQVSSHATTLVYFVCVYVCVSMYGLKFLAIFVTNCTSSNPTFSRDETTEYLNLKLLAGTRYAVDQMPNKTATDVPLLNL
jgi:hypothetical protein